MEIADNFSKCISQFHSIFLDSVALIYHLEDVRPYSILTTEVFTAIVNEALEGIISTVSITELLTKPFREKKHEQIAIFEAFIFSLP